MNDSSFYLVEVEDNVYTVVIADKKETPHDKINKKIESVKTKDGTIGFDEQLQKDIVLDDDYFTYTKCRMFRKTREDVICVIGKIRTWTKKKK